MWQIQSGRELEIQDVFISLIHWWIWRLVGCGIFFLVSQFLFDMYLISILNVNCEHDANYLRIKQNCFHLNNPFMGFENYVHMHLCWLFRHDHDFCALGWYCIAGKNTRETHKLHLSVAFNQPFICIHAYTMFKRGYSVYVYNFTCHPLWYQGDCKGYGCTESNVLPGSCHSQILQCSGHRNEYLFQPGSSPEPFPSSFSLASNKIERFRGALYNDI